MKIPMHAARALILITALTPAYGTTLFFSGNLRSNADIFACGVLCNLTPADSDATWANWAAYSAPFTIYSSAAVQAITFGFAGGTSQTGAVVAAGGLEPYLSLFDSSGDFITSTYFGTTCPAGAGSVGGNCYDVELDSPALVAGTYTLVLSAYANLSLAENYGSGTLADGFSGLGNLSGSENLNFAFDINIPTAATVPEPGAGWMFLVGGAAIAALVKARQPQA